MENKFGRNGHKIAFRIDTKLLERMRNAVPRNDISFFIREAIEEKLKNEAERDLREMPNDIDVEKTRLYLESRVRRS